MSSAPVARGSWFEGALPGLKRDPIEELTAAWRAHGDVTRLRLGPPVLGHVGHLLVHPDHVEHVLVRRAANYQLSAAYEVLGDFLGDGLLTSHGAAWKEHRRLAQPSFAPSRLVGMTPVFVEAAQAASIRLTERDGEPIELGQEMARLTLDAVGRTLFGACLSDEATRVAPALRVVQEFAIHSIYSGHQKSLRALTRLAPTTRARRYRAAVGTLDAVVNRLIAERRRGGTVEDDLLGRLIASTSRDATGDRAVRDETMTFLLAGHETTASALTWTLALLSRHVEARERVHAELDAVLGGRPPTQADLPDLPVLAAVVKESLRLFPPAWTIERRADGDDTIGGYDIPAGSTVILSPYLTHRHPDFWDEPEDFRPDRWLEPDARRPRSAYVPFGAGARQCIGGAFAMLEAQLMLATLMQCVQVDLLPGQASRPTAEVTLTSGAGLAARVQIKRPGGIFHQPLRQPTDRSPLHKPA
jgi:cytochrome P450